MRFTKRDGLILETIHAFDGMMGEYQIRCLFFRGERRAKERLSMLFHNGYLARPDRRRRASISCMVYWLAKRGAEYVAGLSGEDFSEFKYREKPTWLRVEHDLAVNDFRLDVMEACELSPLLELEEWIPQGEFWAYPDTIEYKGNKGRTVKRRIRPDAFFSIRRTGYRHLLLLEIDMATEDNPRFAREKVRPGVAYLQSKAYKRRFGGRSGRWLVVTTGERRMKNMKRQTETTAGRNAGLFYFTTFDRVKPETLFVAPVWLRGGEDGSSALIGT
jgi:hypothetical protein